MKLHKATLVGRIEAFRAEGRPVFACHIQDMDPKQKDAWTELRNNNIGACWTDYHVANHPNSTVYFSPSRPAWTAKEPAPESIKNYSFDALKTKYAQYLLTGDATHLRLKDKNERN